MQQTNFRCPVCQNNDEPVISTSLSMHKCPLCERTFRNSDLIGYEITKGDFAFYWRDKLASKKEIPSGSIVDGITRRRDVDNQMDNITTESTDNLMHEIIMVRIYKKEAEKAEEQVVKSEIDKIFDIILGRD